MTYLLILKQMRVQYVRDRRVVAARCEVRRPGSDHSHIPSLAGGRLIRRSA